LLSACAEQCNPEDILTRNGYRLKEMVELFDARLTEIRAFFNN
jgi:hypothetical protein